MSLENEGLNMFISSWRSQNDFLGPKRKMDKGLRGLTMSRIMFGRGKEWGDEA